MLVQQLSLHGTGASFCMCAFEVVDGSRRKDTFHFSKRIVWKPAMWQEGRKHFIVSEDTFGERFLSWQKCRLD